MENIYQLKITLKHISPLIWRQIQVKADVLLFDLHKIIQATMGWTNSHLHQFIHDNNFYGNSDNKNDFSDFEQIDYSKTKLNKLLTSEKQKMIYEYDFGDGWEHLIELQKILPMDTDKKYPICLDGKRNCPPEDCEGAGGYDDLLNVIKNPEDEEYESMMDWLGGKYDPEYFYKDEINKRLRMKNYGCF